jgi:phage gp46-like protein
MVNQHKLYLFVNDIEWEQILSDYLFLVNVGDEIVNSVYLSKFTPNRASQSKADVMY